MEDLTAKDRALGEEWLRLVKPSVIGRERQVLSAREGPRCSGRGSP